MTGTASAQAGAVADPVATSRQWHLVRRPGPVPTADDVRLVEVALPAIGPGQLLVRNAFLSVEPYMRGRMSAQSSYVEPYALDAPMAGHAVGEVIASQDAAVPVGTWVLHEQGWRDVALVEAREAVPVDVTRTPASAHLGVLGLTGFTAWLGLFEVARCKSGDTVLVSAAAGAVGATVVQLAKARGCTVIGSAGSAEKVRWLVEDLGCDAAFSYRDGPVRVELAAALERAGTDGIDVYFDNVGGEQLEAAVRHMRVFGRIALCGAISVYNATEPVPGPRNLLLLIWRRVRMEGFLTTDHEGRRPDFERDMTAWLASGAVRQVETVVTGGVNQVWSAFEQLLNGGNVGKSVVDVRTGPARH